MLYQVITIVCFLVGFLFNQLIGQESDCHSASDKCMVLTLDSAISRALNYNRPLMNNVDSKVKAEYGIILAQSEFNITFTPHSKTGYVGGGHAGAGMSYGGGIDFGKKFETGTEISFGPCILRTPDKHYHANIQAMISQPLLRGFGRDYQLARLKGAEFNLRSACRSLFTAQIQLTIRTIQSLYEVVKAKKSVELNQASYHRIKAFYRSAKMKEKIGLCDSLDVYRAEIELQQAKDTLTSAEERLLESEDILRDLLALPLDTCISVDVPLIYTPSNVKEEEAIKYALDHRIEMDQAEDQWREAYRQSKVDKENLYPDINLVLDYTNTGRHEYFTSCWRRRESKWGIGFSTSGDFDPLGNELAYQTTLSAIDAAERGMEQVKANLNLDVKRAIRQLYRIHKRINLQEEQIKTSEGQLYLAQIKFNRGMANNFDVIQAEKTLRSAQLTYWSALIDHIVGEYQLLAAIGLLTDKPCIE